MTPKRTQFTAPVLETCLVTDDTKKDPETGAPIASEINVIEAKHFVEENEK